MIRAVTFDFWNTLVAEQPDTWKARVAAQRAALERVGVAVGDDDIERAIERIRRWFDERWLANQVVDPDIGAAQMISILGLDAAHPAAVELAEVFRSGSDPSRLTVAPGIGDVLEGLRARGVRVGIVCDAGFSPGTTLRTYLRHHGLLDHFDHASFSDEVGWFKPDPRIFAHAFDGLAMTDPASMAHVGDLRRTDVGGATAVGWTAVRYRGLNDDTSDAPDAGIVLDHHDDLLDALGL